MAKNEDDKKVTVYTPGGLFKPTGLFFEQIEGNQYIMWDSEGKEFVKEDYVNYDEMYVPLQRVPWLLCKEPKEYADLTELWSAIYDFIHKHLFLPDKNLYDLLTAWVIASWTPEFWSVVPYIFFHGPVSSGKTRGLEVLQRLCYRSIISSNISTAALFRTCDAWHPTLVLDETEIYNKVERGEIIGLLNSGYRRGQYAIRVKNTEQGMELEVFDVFGGKALAGTEALKATLESRSIPIHMIKNRRKVNLFINEDEAHEIRCKLLMYRMKTLRFETTKESLGKPIERELSERCERFLEGVPPLDFADGRTQELFQCLLAVSNHGQENILKYAKKMVERRSFEEKASVEAELVEIFNSPNLIIEENVALTKDVADKFNESRNEREKWKSSSVGRLIRRLGFQKIHTRKGNGWLIDRERLEYLTQIYTGVTPTLENSSHSSYGSHSNLAMPLLNSTIQEVIEKVKPYLTTCFDEDKLIQRITALGISKEKAKKLFDFLVDHEMIGRDDVGLWHWTTRR